MTPDNVKALFWQRLLFVAESETNDTGGDDFNSQLLGIDEGFGHCFDPVDDFPEYVAVRLCRAFRQRDRASRQ